MNTNAIHYIRPVSDLLATMDAIIRFERRKRTGKNCWHLFLNLITWCVPTAICGTGMDY